MLKKFRTVVDHLRPENLTKKTLLLLIVLNFTLLSVSCATSYNYIVPQFRQRQLLPNPNVPGEFFFNHLDMEHPYKCGFLGMKQCYPFISEIYKVTDPETWKKIVDTGMALEVPEQLN